MAHSIDKRKLILLSFIFPGTSTEITTRDPVVQRKSNNLFGTLSLSSKPRQDPAIHLHGLLETGDVVRLSHPCVDQDLPQTGVLLSERVHRLLQHDAHGGGQTNAETGEPPSPSYFDGQQGVTARIGRSQSSASDIRNLQTAARTQTCSFSLLLVMRSFHLVSS